MNGVELVSRISELVTIFCKKKACENCSKTCLLIEFRSSVYDLLCNEVIE
jgi:hypothetical protein